MGIRRTRQKGEVMIEAAWLSFGIAFFLNVTYIALKAFQQLNVMHNKYLWVFPISFSMALCEVLTTKLIVANGVLVFIPIGLGGGLGCVFAMWMHAKLRSRKVKVVSPSTPVRSDPTP